MSARQATVPAFSSSTRARPTAPACGSSSVHSPQRTASGPFAMGGSLGRVEPLLVRAARREAVERTPVWFMRQAGRSLPEYRAIREQHAFFEVNRSAELTAEVTLQPVRRHDVDAAVMFADIMTPVVAMGLDVELVEGVGPVVREPVRSLAAVEKLRVPDPEETMAPILEAIGIVRRELAARPGGRRLLRRAVHRRRLPRRGQAVARVRGHEDADVRRARGVARAARQARRHVRGVRGRAGARGRRRRAALRLVGRQPLAGRLRRVRRAVVGRACSPRCATRACPRSTSAPAPRRCSPTWPRSAAT